VLTPFARNELERDPRCTREFNHKISCARVVVEWAFGRLKSRFPALKRLGAAHDIKDIYRAIEAMMILHNLCFDLGDIPEYSRARLDDEGGGGAAHNEVEDDLEEEEDDDELEHHEVGGNDADLLRAGRAFRERCMDKICPLFD
jgi:hypothetical protein